MRWTSKPNIISERKETIEMRIQHKLWCWLSSCTLPNPPVLPRPGARGAPPKPSEAGSVGRGGATERASFAACGEARDSKSAPTKGVLQLLQ